MRAIRALTLFVGLALHAQLARAIDMPSYTRRALSTTTSDPTTSDVTSDLESTPTTDDTSLCPAEYGACLADPACLECAGFIEAAYDGCRAPDYNGLTATCSEKEEAGCCQLEGSVDCVTNTLLAAVYGG